MKRSIRMNFKLLDMCRRLALVLLITLSPSYVTAVENYPDSHGHSHDLSRDHADHHPGEGTETYSCNLISYTNQCREYSVLEGAEDTFLDLKEGCESMSGAFKKTVCATEGLTATCTDIVRNYHKPDVIYDNYYYQGKPSNWSNNVIERVCGDLGGEFISN